jgi:hypothetical protein
MASEALNWALANGMTQAEFDNNIFNAVLAAQQPNSGVTNADLRIEMDRLGISPADVARATGVSTESVASQYAAATPTTTAELVSAAAAANELAARTARDPTASQSLIDARNLAAKTATGNLTAAQKTAVTPVQAALVTKQNEAALALQQRNERNAAAAAAEKARLDALKKTGVTGTVSSTAIDTLLGPTGNESIAGTTPFANATQGFAQNFGNYTSIPIGAQYNPNAVGGTGSPYSQIMGQMRPLGNPYAGVVAGQAMGGYNPALYDQIAAVNAINAATQQTASALPQTGMELSSTGGMAKGGYVHGGLMFGANPPGPDDGAVNLDMGEYVIKKSSVDKYGRGLLDMINEGKVPAKKMKSLLG